MSSTAPNRNWKFFRGIRFRLTFVYATLFGLFLAIFAYIISGRFIEEVNRDFDSALLNYAIDLSTQAELYHSGIRTIYIPEKDFIKHFPFPVGKTYFLLRSKNGDVLARSQRDIPLEIPYAQDFFAQKKYTHVFVSIQGEEESYRAVNLKLTAEDHQEMILQVATPDSMLREQEDRFLLINILTIPFLLIFSSIVSYVIAGNALNPLRDITQAVQNIAAKNLSLRVPVPETSDEIEELSLTFNTLLNRLEKSFKAQENFVSNASHQLNTPLAIIKGELDVFESKKRDLEEHEKFRRSIREEVERLIELVRNMLLISRVEAGQENFTFHPVRLDEALLAVSSRLAPRAQEKQITIRFNIAETLAASDEIDVMGEKQLIECLFENLLENAIKYSPPASTISIDLLPGPGRLAVHIADQGPGMEDDEFKKVSIHRFHRGSPMIPGTGIGLPIAFQIAEYHQAEISYSKLHPKGSLFQVVFPK
jgi:signal transduction histidine kinase